MSSSVRPAAIGGDPVMTERDQPPWPSAGAIGSAALAEITEHEEWVGYNNHPAKWRAILEQVVADTTGYSYGIGQPNGTLGIASGLRAQLLTRDAEWSRGAMRCWWRT